MRITGGEWRSRVLQVPQDQGVTRPTMDQTRLAVFNILNSAEWALRPNGQSLVYGGIILDGYAGCGTYAFESLSRGAAFAFLMEKDGKTVQTIQKNSEALKCTSQIKIIRGDINKTIPHSGEAVAVCFLDPPYTDQDWPKTLQHLHAQKWIDANTLIVLEVSSKLSREANALAEDILNLHDQRRYGHALVMFGQLK